MAISEGLAEHLLFPPQAGLVVSINTELLYDPASPLGGVLPKERKQGLRLRPGHARSWLGYAPELEVESTGTNGYTKCGFLHTMGHRSAVEGKQLRHVLSRGRTLKTFAAAGARHKRPRAAGFHASGMSRQANPLRQNVDQRLLEAEGGGGAGKSLLLGMG